MELRSPPQKPEQSSKQKTSLNISLFGLIMVTLLTILALQLSNYVAGVESGNALRHVAAQLQSAGITDESAKLYEQYLTHNTNKPDYSATAFSLAENYVDQGQFEKALSWLYRAERHAKPTLKNKIAQKIVYCLERLGKVQAANNALNTRTSISAEQRKRDENDKLVAKIGSEEIYRSDIEEAMSALPPGMAKQFDSREKKQLFLQQMIADTLLAQKARKLQMHKQPEYTHKLEQLGKQILVNEYMDKEILKNISPKDIDLQNHYTANQGKFKLKDAKEPLPFEKVKAQVERDYKQLALSTAIQEMLAQEVASKGVELFMEALND